MKSTELVIFDWDGTLMDSAQRIVNCMQQAFTLNNLEVPSPDEVKRVIGISLVPAVETLLQSSNRSMATSIAEAYKDVFINHDKTPSPLFNNVVEMLESLVAQGKTVAVATGKARRGLDRAMQQTNTTHFFRFSRCADEASSKPSPDMLNQLLSASGIAAENAVMVGDTTYDLEMAKAAGIKGIGVSYGVHQIEELENCAPHDIAHDVKHLMNLLGC